MSGAGRGPLVLSGTMGVGKSAVGRRLAKLLGWRFVEADEATARHLGSPAAADALEAHGERWFRRAEAEVVPGLLRGRTVVALGGGSASVEAVSRALEGRDVARLTASMEEIERRVGDGAGRPLWPRRRELARERAAGPGVPVDTSGLTPGAVAGRVLRTLFGGPPRALGRTGRVSIGWGAVSAPVAGPRVDLVEERLGALSADLPPGALATLPVRGGEAAKSLRGVERFLAEFEAAGLDRDGSVLALGGGALTDAVGVAAGLYLRGVALHLVPSSLLGMCDASIGGKYAVNAGRLKNRAGLFRMPDSVRLDPTLLAGLPRREVKSGIAEVVKASWLDPAARERLAPFLPGMGEGRLAALEKGVQVAARMKMRIVAEDPEERKGRRALLNFGHTLGHALEAASRPRPRHGEAVAVGMLAVARWSEATGRAVAGTAAALEGDLRAAGVVPRLPAAYDRGDVLEAMARDKKRAGGRTLVVVPLEPGRLGLEEMEQIPADDWLATVG